MEPLFLQNPALIANAQIGFGSTGNTILQTPSGLYDFLRDRELSLRNIGPQDLYDTHHALQVLQTGANETKLPMSEGLRTSMTLLFKDYYDGYGFDYRAKRTGCRHRHFERNTEIAFGRLMDIARALVMEFNGDEKLEAFNQAVASGMMVHQVFNELPPIPPEPEPGAEPEPAAPLKADEPPSLSLYKSLRAKHWMVRHPIVTSFLGAVIYLVGHSVYINTEWLRMSPVEKTLALYSDAVEIKDDQGYPFTYSKIEGFTGRQARILETVLGKLKGPLSDEDISALQEAEFSKDFIEELAGPDRLNPTRAMTAELIKKLEGAKPNKNKFDDNEEEKSRRTLRTLARFGPQAKGGTVAIENILKNSKFAFETRNAAFRALLTIAPDTPPSPEWGLAILTILYKSQDEDTTKTAQKVLEQLGESTVEELKKRIPKMHLDELTAIQPILTNLGEKAEPLAEVLGKRLEDTDINVAISTAQTLGKMPKVAVSSIPYLIKALSDPNYEVVSAAIDALVELGEESAQIALPYLEKMAEENSGTDTPLSKASREAIEKLKEKVK